MCNQVNISLAAGDAVPQYHRGWVPMASNSSNISYADYKKQAYDD